MSARANVDASFVSQCTKRCDKHECVEHEEFTCPACKKRRPWREGCDDEDPALAALCDARWGKETGIS